MTSELCQPLAETVLGLASQDLIHVWALWRGYVSLQLRISDLLYWSMLLIVLMALFILGSCLSRWYRRHSRDGDGYRSLKATTDVEGKVHWTQDLTFEERLERID